MNLDSQSLKVDCQKSWENWDTHIKKQTYPAKQDEPDVQKEREIFWQTIKDIPVENLVPLDESSVNLGYTRLYGRAKTNERIKEGIIDVRFERQSILSTIKLNGDMCPIVFDGTLNKEIFAHYIKICLAPALEPDDVVLLYQLAI